MKKMIKAPSVITAATSSSARAKAILDLASELFDVLDDTSEEIFEEYDLQPLYDELNETVYTMAHKIDAEYR